MEATGGFKPNYTVDSSLISHSVWLWPSAILHTGLTSVYSVLISRQYTVSGKNIALALREGDMWNSESGNYHYELVISSSDTCICQ